MQFTTKPLAIPDVMLIVRRQFKDSRGYFMVTHEASEFQRLGLPAFVQDNQAQSVRKGTIRGMHFQRPPHAQAKLVWPLRGAIFDAAIDVRAGSATFGRWVGATLTAGSGEAILVPRGFAHGYCTLEDDTEVAYKVDAPYAPEADAGVAFADPAVGIAWPVRPEEIIASDKDRGLPPLSAIVTPFIAEARQ